MTAEDPESTGMTAVIGVSGMFCSSCAAAVEHAVARMPGIVEAAAHVAADAVVVRWDDRIVNVDTIRRRIEALGYRTYKDGEMAGTGEAVRGRFAIRLAVAIFFGMWSMAPAMVLYFGGATANNAWGLALASGVLAIPVLLYSAWPFYVAGWRTLRAGAPGIDALIALGVIAMTVTSTTALFRGDHRVFYDAAVMLVVFQLVARLIDDRSRAGSAARLRGLLDPGSGSARRLSFDDREVTQVPGAILMRDDRVICRADDVLVIDGSIESGQMRVDRSRLTGESRPLALHPGDAAFASDVVVDGEAVLRVRAIVGRRRVDQLAMSVKRVLTSKPSWQRWVDRVARNFLFASLALSIGSGIFVVAWGADLYEGAVRALSVFVVACPCALSLAVPLAAARTMQVAANEGILIRDLDVIQGFRSPDCLFLDKTGTVTEGTLEARLAEISSTVDVKRAWQLTSDAASGSDHPLSRALLSAAASYGISPTTSTMLQHEIHKGLGVSLESPVGVVHLGSRAWLVSLGVEVPAEDSGTTAHLAIDHRWAGRFEFEARIRDGIVQVVQTLLRDGIQVRLISGDHTAEVTRVAAMLGIPGAGMKSPEQKLEAIVSAQGAGASVAFCGDGTNDAPALAAAPFGVAVAEGTSMACTAASITLLRGGAERLPMLFAFLGHSRRVIRGNLLWAITYNVAMVPAAMMGLASPEIAALAMSLSSLAVVMNSARIRVLAA